MGGKRRESGLRALRRGAALGLALTALWIFGLTADLSGAWDALGRLGQTPSFVLGALSQELEGAPAGDGLSPDLDRWGRLLLAQSALLSGGRPAVDAFLAEQAQAEEPPAEPIDQEENDQEEPELSPVQHGEVVEYTNLGKDDGSYLTTDQIYVKNSTQGQEVDVAALASQPVDLKLGAGPQILIVHTHGSEAYTQDEQDVYVESDPYRTTDCTKNVVRVGEEMAQVFRSQGFEVVHDTTLYDYPAYNGAYERSCAGVEKWLEQYPTIKLVLDVHRDALVSADGAAYKLVSEVEGQKVAQVMRVVGSNDSGMEHPNWRENLALAVKLQLELTRDWGQLARPITLRSSRYNQHLSPGSLLVEVGGHGNTLQEAIAGARLFAQSIGQVLKTMEEP